MAEIDWDFVPAPASEILNQSGDLSGYNAYLGDQILMQAIDTFGGGAGQERLDAFGSTISSDHMRSLSQLASRSPPSLIRFDRFGNQVDCVIFHPTWHCLMQYARDALTHALPWRQPAPSAHVVGRDWLIMARLFQAHLLIRPRPRSGRLSAPQFWAPIRCSIKGTLPDNDPVQFILDRTTIRHAV